MLYVALFEVFVFPHESIRYSLSVCVYSLKSEQTPNLAPPAQEGRKGVLEFIRDGRGI